MLERIERLPKLILFDYGETLVHEERFDNTKYYEKMFEFAIENPNNITANDLAKELQEINEELGRFDPQRKGLYNQEITEEALLNYLLQKNRICLSKTYDEIANLLWNAGSKASPMEGIEELLASLRKLGIRTAVVSNISYSGESLHKRLKKIIPSHEFEFIIASSDIGFRKPGRRIFELALKKGNVQHDEVWYCGDQYTCDIEGAIQAGIQPIWYHTIDKNMSISDNIICLEHWNELQKLLEMKEDI